MAANLKQFRVLVTSTGIMVADVLVDAINAQEASEIAKESVKPEDFEVSQVDQICSIECMEV